MDFVLNRKGGVPLHDQLLAQLELKILSGAIAPGQRLPSVRVLARRLGLHANTVSSAYRDLESAGHVELRRGAGVYVRAGAPGALEEARGLDEMIRLAVAAAFRRGHSGVEIRAAVERWMRAAPPGRVLIVDPRPETLELVAHEIRSGLNVPVSGCTLEELAGDASLASGALLLSFPYHAGKVGRLAPTAPVATIHTEASALHEPAIAAAPSGAIVLIVSRSPIVLKFASATVGSMRGDEVLVEARLLSRRAEWTRLLPSADVVFADALAAPVLRAAGARRLHEFRVLDERVLQRVREALGTALTTA